MLDIGFVTNKCLETIGIDSVPEYIKMEFLDSVEFFRLTQKGVPEDYTINIPVLTIPEGDMIYIYTNLTELQARESYVTELLVFQLLKTMFETGEKAKSFRSVMKNNFLFKNIEYGGDILFEYLELLATYDTMKLVFESEADDENHPYSYKQTRKIGLKMLASAHGKEGRDRVSTFLYAIVKLCSNGEIYNFHNVLEFKVANLLWELTELLLSTEVETATAQQLNKIGSLCRSLEKK